MAHAHPLDLSDSHTQGSTALEQSLFDPKALVRMHQARRPVLDEGAGMHIDTWPDLGTVHTNPDVYFEASALLEGEQKISLPSADSEQAVASKTCLSSSLPCVAATRHARTRLEARRSRTRHDAAQHPARLKPPDRTAEDSDEAGGAWRASALVNFDCSQLEFAVEMGDIEAPNPRMVEAKRKAEWPREDWQPRTSAA
jgi:hypothetical protein